MTVLIVLQVLVPLGLLAWLGLGRAASRVSWLLRAVIVAAYLVTVATAGLWLAIPRVGLWVLLAAFPVAAIVGYRRVPGGALWPRGGRWTHMRVAVLYALALLMAVVAGLALFGRTPPAVAAADLPLPLRAGTYYVANGGSNRILNAHLAIPDSARARFRGQLLGVDLVRVDRLGRRARGFLPPDPMAYAIFGDTVFAPCGGRVVAARDGLGDLAPPTPDREHMEGNHVRLACTLPLEGEPAPVWVLLAHLQQGSVRVAAGDSVAAGQPLGRVGNTGNSNEPHLHIHAQHPGTELAPNGGEPIPLRLGGRYLARNDRIAAPSAPTAYPSVGGRP